MNFRYVLRKPNNDLIFWLTGASAMIKDSLGLSSKIKL